MWPTLEFRQRASDRQGEMFPEHAMTSNNLAVYSRNSNGSSTEPSETPNRSRVEGRQLTDVGLRQCTIKITSEFKNVSLTAAAVSVHQCLQSGGHIDLNFGHKAHN